MLAFIHVVASNRRRGHALFRVVGIVYGAGTYPRRPTHRPRASHRPMYGPRLVRPRGFEPPHHKILVPKTSASAIPPRALVLLCSREDSNLHPVARTSPSSWRVYHFTTTANY